MKPIKLTNRALEDLKNVKVFCTKLYGNVKAKEITDDIFKHLKILEANNYKFDEIGEIDNSFSHLKYEYRKLLKSHFKITYRVGKTKIYIFRVFDTRQNPRKNL